MKKKQKLNNTLDIIVVPSRVKAKLDEIINFEVNQSLEEMKSAVIENKKEGKEKPVPPSRIDSKASDEEKKKHAELRRQYLKDLSEYNKYKNEKFTESYNLYSFCRRLLKLAELLDKKPSEYINKQIDDLTSLLKGQDPPHWEGEDPGIYKQRKERNEKAKFAVFLDGLDLKDKSKIKEYVENILKNNEQVKNLYDRDIKSHDRFRFGNTAAVMMSCILEFVITEVISYGLEVTCSLRKKTMQPEHCIIEDRNNIVYPFIFNLPHQLELIKRRERKLKWEQEYEKARMQYIRKQFTKNKFVYPSFKEVEVEEGNAICVIKNDKNGEKKSYEWYGIDISEGHDSSSFVNFVNRICNKVLENSTRYVQNTIISSKVKKYLANLAVDLIVRIASLITIILNINEGCIITENIIKSALSIILVDSYPKLRKNTKINLEHEDLFKIMDSKVLKLQEFKKQKKLVKDNENKHD